MRTLTVVLAAVVASALLAGPAGAAAQMSEKDYRAALAACKKEANPKKRDECVSNAKNRYEKGKAAEKKASGMQKSTKSTAKSQTDAASKGAQKKATDAVKGAQAKGSSEAGAASNGTMEKMKKQQ